MTIHRAVLTTKEIAETAHYYGAKKRNRYAIPVAGALQLPEQALPIPPYALGVWLGDGHSYGSQITCHRDDLEIADHLHACGMEVEVTSKDRRFPHILTLKPTLPWPAHICRRGHDMNVLGRHGNGQCAECGRQFSMQWKHGSAVDPVLEEGKPFSLRLREMGLAKDRKTPETGKHILGECSTLRRRLYGASGFWPGRGDRA
ncbi:hypothetical protein [Marivita sp.]|jgi:replicative DNA helicase|uniref:hypothetical protein n=1 Tax=Marivita sp. TaxID=2003365 RepID=UPI002617A169|nr:hypothetical protein [Marivita sp.]